MVNLINISPNFYEKTSSCHIGPCLDLDTAAELFVELDHTAALHKELTPQINELKALIPNDFANKENDVSFRDLRRNFSIIQKKLTAQKDPIKKERNTFLVPSPLQSSNSIKKIINVFKRKYPPYKDVLNGLFSLLFKTITILKDLHTSLPRIYLVAATVSAVAVFVNPLAATVAAMGILISWLVHQILEKAHSLSNTAGLNSFEGSDQQKAASLALRALEKLNDGTLPIKVQKELCAATKLLADDEAFSLKALNRIQKGKLVILPTGYQSSVGGHLAYTVIYNNKMFICNKGSRIDQDSIKGFNIDSSLITLDLLKNLKSFDQKFQSGKDPETHLDNYLYNALPLALNGAPIPMYKKLISKNQKVGNCSFANLKAAYKMAIFMMGDDSLKGCQDAIKLKSSISYAMRQKAIDEAKLIKYLIPKTFSNASLKLASYAKRKLKLFPSENC